MKRLVLLLPIVMLATLACNPPPPSPPPISQPPAVTGPPIPSCFDETVNPDGYDLHYVGPENTEYNLYLKGSRDGSCTIGSAFAMTAVVAADETSALQVCQGIDPLFSYAHPFGLQTSLSPSTGPYFWGCG